MPRKNETYGVLRERLDKRSCGFEVGFEVGHSGGINRHKRANDAHAVECGDSTVSVWNGDVRPSYISVPVVQRNQADGR